jgi:hypothetical protein
MDLSTNVPLGPTQPMEHFDHGLSQTLEEIDAIVNAAKQTLVATPSVEY